MRESFVRALAGLAGLGWGFHEKPVDRLSSLGAAQINRSKPGANVAQQRRARHAQRLSNLASLGVDLIALKGSRRELSRRLAVTALAELMDEDLARSGREPIPVDRLFVIAHWAVREWCEDACPPRPHGCGGAGEVPREDSGKDGAQRMTVCPECGGTTRRRWKDSERERAMGARYEHEMSIAHKLIADAAGLATQRGIRQLGRSSG